MLYPFTRKNGVLSGMLAALILAAGCSKNEEPPPSVDTQEAAPSAETPQSQIAMKTSPEPSEAPAPPAAHGVVIANRDLGMAVSGQGAGSPGRSLDVLERQVTTLLPELRDVYEHERTQDPALMGSLDVNMSIEPNGAVSDLRFPVKRVSNERLTTAVFNQMRAWMFPPAELPVQLRFTLLFVPPGMDEASILFWEKRLGSRPVVERIAEPQVSPDVVAAARLTEKKPQNEAAKKRDEASPQTSTKPTTVAKTAPLESSRPDNEQSPVHEITGWYRVLYPTVLRSAPQSSAGPVTRLGKGVRVRVVRVVKGQWLEVRSISNRPPGYLWWEDAVPERDEQAGKG
jgi:hypothetical protein